MPFGREALTYSIEWLSVLLFLVVGTVLSQDIDVFYSRVRRGTAPEHPWIRVFALLTLCFPTRRRKPHPVLSLPVHLIWYRPSEREGAAVLK